MAEVSVIIPVYNCEAYIREAVRSVQRQTFADWELILVNDGSTDRSGEICRSLAAGDSRIRVIEKENGGGGGEARNVGMEHARAPFIAFLDSDDEYRPRMLQMLAEAQREADYDIVLAGYEEFAESEEGEHPVCYPEAEIRGREAVRDFFIRHYPEGMIGFPWNKLYRTSIIREHQLRMPRMRRLEDGIFNAEYFSFCTSCRVVADTGYRYRESRQVETGKLPYDFYEIMEVFVEHYYGILKRWGRDARDSEAAIVDYFQNDFICCLENILRPEWKKTGKERMEYIRQLREEPLVRYMLERPCPGGRYVRAAIGMYRKRQYRRLCVWMKAKYLLKTRYSRLFYKLKSRVN